MRIAHDLAVAPQLAALDGGGERLLADGLDQALGEHDDAVAYAVRLAA